jgi:DNA-binding transcriptional MerR regulator
MLRERAAAEALGVTQRTLREWRSAGTAPNWRKLNGTVWFSVQALADFLNGDGGSR